MTSARLVYVLSPAKTLNMATTSITQCTQPRFLSDTHELIEQLRSLSHTQVKSLLGVNDALTKLNYDRYQAFDTLKTATEATNPSKSLKQAVLAFHGPAYQGLDAQHMSTKDLHFAQSHLRILSGLYGILRPLDLIQPYRFEMGQKFHTNRGKNLYEFWAQTLVFELDALFSREEANEGMKQQRVLVNVASQEYFKTLSCSALTAAGIVVVHCVFKDDGKIKSVYAKRARGLMCKYLIQNRVDSLEGIARFNLEGYQFSNKVSSDDTYVFTRTGAAKEKLRLQQIKAMFSQKTKREANRTEKNVDKTQSTDEIEIDDTGNEHQPRRSMRKKQKTK
ncbi:unnamed protein product [Peronospora belbahrii]|uniref:Uncharacterized protein n=1 Tax=Peronospora belbahrii TaxID=622444 RepID=A0ABN8CVE9_9STRA|nr:unnamed protein product [Peronospora belbahrii]